MSAHQQAIQRISRTMMAASFFAAAVSIALIVWLWASPDRLEYRLIPLLHLEQGYRLDTEIRVKCLLATLLPLAVLVFMFAEIYRLFAAFSRGEIFTVGAARHIRLVAVSIAALGVMRPLAMGFYRYMLADPATEFEIEIGVQGLLVFLFAGFLLAIALVMEEAARLRADLDSIV